MADPIDLDKLSVSLAASMISAQRYLLQANQELDDLHQDSTLLSEMPRSRFTLGSVSFEVPYVVDSIVAPDPPTPAEVRVTKDVELTASDLASLRRGASETSLQQFDALVSDYAQVKAGLRQAVQTREAAKSSAPTSLKRLAPTVEIGKEAGTELANGANKVAVTKLARLLEDYQSARTSYQRIKETLAGGSLPRLAVRIDPESIAGATGSVHRMNLQFNSEDQPSIRANGQNLP
ncbi:MAG: hypothetical protein IPK50_20265 [Fibrobacterota bacterium]|nr:hypothetical protein [Fibrobacterota bacterium]QQS04592.1 MAG: hypothetical protein IPK50_20265 [Fibrobacterota bacterium]